MPLFRPDNMRHSDLRASSYLIGHSKGGWIIFGSNETCVNTVQRDKNNDVQHNCTNIDNKSIKSQPYKAYCIFDMHISKDSKLTTWSKFW